MRPQRRRKKKKPTPGSRKRLPSKFICIAPDEARHVFDFINGSAKDHEKEIARLHFHLCLHCQEAVARLHAIKEVVSENAKELLHREGAYSGSSGELNSADLQREVQMLASDAEALYMKAAGEM